eukprot:SAG31_NODE_16172_length_720_cov_0.945250_2_plen_50_part_00
MYSVTQCEALIELCNSVILMKHVLVRYRVTYPLDLSLLNLVPKDFEMMM